MKKTSKTASPVAQNSATQVGALTAASNATAAPAVKKIKVPKKFEKLAAINLFEGLHLNIDAKSFATPNGYSYLRFEMSFDESKSPKDPKKLGTRWLMSGYTLAHEGLTDYDGPGGYGMDFSPYENPLGTPVAKAPAIDANAQVEKLIEKLEKMTAATSVEEKRHLMDTLIDAAPTFVKRISRSNLEQEGNEWMEKIDFLKSANLLAGYSLSMEGSPVESFKHTFSALHEHAHLMKLGPFTNSSDTLWISDPCYQQNGSEGVLLEGTGGVWESFATRQGFGSWGDRVASLVILRPHVDPNWALSQKPSAWKSAGGVGVDSGQAGFMDASVFTDGADNDALYTQCCDATLHFFGAGTLKGAAVSSSGDGDGGYDVEALYSKTLTGKKGDNEVIGVKINYYPSTPKKTLDAFAKKYAEVEAKAIMDHIAPIPVGPSEKVVQPGDAILPRKSTGKKPS